MENHTNDPEETQAQIPSGATESETQDATPTETTENETSNDLAIDTLDLEALVAAFEKLMAGDQWLKHRGDIDQITQRFQSLFTTEFENQKARFLEEGGNEIDFSYRPLFKTQFEALYQD